MSVEAIEAIENIAKIDKTIGKLSESVTNIREFCDNLKTQAGMFMRQLRSEELKVISSMANYRYILLQMKIMLVESNLVLERNIKGSNNVVKEYYCERNEGKIAEEPTSNEEVNLSEHSESQLECPCHSNQEDQPSSSNQNSIDSEFAEKMLLDITEVLLPFKKRFEAVEHKFKLFRQMNELDFLLPVEMQEHKSIGTQTDPCACSKGNVNKTSSTNLSNSDKTSKNSKEEKRSKTHTNKSKDCNEHKKKIENVAMNKENLTNNNNKEHDKKIEKTHKDKQSNSSKAPVIETADKSSKELSNKKNDNKTCDTKSKSNNKKRSVSSKLTSGSSSVPSEDNNKQHEKKKESSKLNGNKQSSSKPTKPSDKHNQESIKSKDYKQSNTLKTSHSKVEEKPEENNKKENKKKEKPKSSNHIEKTTEDSSNKKESSHSKEKKQPSQLKASIDSKGRDKDNQTNTSKLTNNHKEISQQKITQQEARKPKDNQDSNHSNSSKLLTCQKDVISQKEIQIISAIPNNKKDLIQSVPNDPIKIIKHSLNEFPKPIDSQKLMASNLYSQNDEDISKLNEVVKECEIIQNLTIKKEDDITSMINAMNDESNNESDTTLLLEEIDTGSLDIKPNLEIIKCENIPTFNDTDDSNSEIIKLSQICNDPKLVVQIPIVVLENLNIEQTKHENVMEKNVKNLTSEENKIDEGNNSTQAKARLNFADFKLKYKDRLQNASNSSTANTPPSNTQSKIIKDKINTKDNKSNIPKRKRIGQRGRISKIPRIDIANMITYIPIINLDAIGAYYQGNASSPIDNEDVVPPTPQALLNPVDSTHKLDLGDITSTPDCKPVSSIYQFIPPTVVKKPTSNSPFKYHAVNEKVLYLPPNERDHKRFSFNNVASSICPSKDNTEIDNQPKNSEVINVSKVESLVNSETVCSVSEIISTGNHPEGVRSNTQEVISKNWFSRDPRRKGFYIETGEKNDEKGTGGDLKPYETIHIPANLAHFKSNTGNI